ncbi:MAG: hypothetical protein AAF690_21375 [Acidobacteriota bacterium]
MQQFKGLWGWMFLPLVVVQAGVFLDYWGDFASNPWAVHIHYWNATLWYVFLISQPWLFAKGRMESHRFWGLVGLLLAGAMILQSTGQFNRDIVYANSVRDSPERWGPFEPWFFFQVMMMEMILISAFTVQILMAVARRKSPPDHAWWMASTAFTIMMPGLGRGLQNAWLGIYGFTAENKAALYTPNYICQGIIVAMALGFAWKVDKLKHPATILAVGANMALFFLEPVARSPAVQAFWRGLIAH